jgi:hypothetical protein
MTIDRLIALISSLGTLFSSILVLFTLIEMQKQRKNTIKPELVFPQLDLYAYWKQHNNIFLPEIWSSEEIQEDRMKMVINRLLIPSLKIDGYNIGIGAAKKIEISWDFDIEEIIKRIKTKDKNNIIEIRYCVGKLFQLQFGRPLNISINLGNDMKSSADYLLPTSVKLDPLKIKLPSSFIILWSVLFYLENINNGGNTVIQIQTLDFEDLLLRLCIKYTDIGNNHYEQRFNIGINVFFRKLCKFDFSYFTLCQ